MNEDTDKKHADVTEFISKHNMKTGLDIKQEQFDVEEFSTDCNDSCLNIKEATDISSYKVGYVSEYSKQVKSEVGFQNNHRGCDLKPGAVECKAELISKHNMKIGLVIKQEQTDVEGSSTGYNGSSLNIKVATDIASYEVGYASEYSLQVKNEVGFENDHRGCDLKQEAVECNFKQNDVKEVDSYAEDNREEVELDDSKDFKIDIGEHDLSNDVLNTDVIINSSLGKMDFTCEHSLRVESEVSSDRNHHEFNIKQEAVEDNNFFESPCNTVDCERKDECFQYNFGQNKSMIKYGLKMLVESRDSKKVEQLQCNSCNYKTNYEPRLVSHFKAEHHEASEMYQCQFCLYNSKDKSDLKKHLFYKHNETSNWYQCNLCNFKTRFKHHLVRHCEWKHNIYHCKLCGLKCETKCKCAANPKQHQCQFCESKYKSKDSLREHIRYKHNENASWYQCNVCNYKSTYKNGLIVHFKRKHGENPEIYQCEFCQCKYKYKDSLKKHICYKHSENIKLYQCNMCNYKTKYKQSLTMHSIQKHDENSEIYKCEFCECKSKSKDYLKKHIHLKHKKIINWYQCNLCNFKTKYKYSLTYHFEGKHNENPEMHHCQFCGRKYKSKYTLKRHVYRQHNKNIN